jgi:hypothetical protein
VKLRLAGQETFENIIEKTLFKTMHLDIWQWLSLLAQLELLEIIF